MLNLRAQRTTTSVRHASRLGWVEGTSIRLHDWLPLHLHNSGSLDKWASTRKAWGRVVDRFSVSNRFSSRCRSDPDAFLPDRHTTIRIDDGEGKEGSEVA